MDKHKRRVLHLCNIPRATTLGTGGL